MQISMKLTKTEIYLDRPDSANEEKCVFDFTMKETIQSVVALTFRINKN